MAPLAGKRPRAPRSRPLPGADTARHKSTRSRGNRAGGVLGLLPGSRRGGGLGGLRRPGDARRGGGRRPGVDCVLRPWSRRPTLSCDPAYGNKFVLMQGLTVQAGTIDAKSQPRACGGMRAYREDAFSLCQVAARRCHDRFVLAIERSSRFAPDVLQP
jgi:hypothetical protein